MDQIRRLAYVPLTDKPLETNLSQGLHSTFNFQVPALDFYWQPWHTFFETRPIGDSIERAIHFSWTFQVFIEMSLMHTSECVADVLEALNPSECLLIIYYLSLDSCCCIPQKQLVVIRKLDDEYIFWLWKESLASDILLLFLHDTLPQFRRSVRVWR